MALGVVGSNPIFHPKPMHMHRLFLWKMEFDKQLEHAVPGIFCILPNRACSSEELYKMPEMPKAWELRKESITTCLNRWTKSALEVPRGERNGNAQHEVRAQSPPKNNRITKIIRLFSIQYYHAGRKVLSQIKYDREGESHIYRFPILYARFPLWRH